MDRFYKACYGIFLVLLGAIQGCKINEFEGNILPNDPGISTKTYPLEFPSKAGYGGSITFSKAEDGTSLVSFQLAGLQANSRYFGKLSVSNAADFANSADLADLGEISGSTGTGKYWLKKNYKNKALLFDSLLVMDAKVRILEIDPAILSPKEVLRGDIGSNALLEGKKSFTFQSLNASGISGQTEVRQRINGKFFLTSTLGGIESGQSLPVSFFRGIYETGDFKKVDYLGNYSAGQEKAYYSYAGWVGNLGLLDTLIGFLGVEAQNSTADSIRLVSICNFGGNQSSGRTKTYSLFKESDSSLIANLNFYEVGSKLRMKFQPVDIPGGNQLYLSLNRNNALSSPDSFFYKPISPGQILEFSNVGNGSGGILNFDDLSTWNAHARITEQGFSNEIGKADLGANEILLTDSIIGNLSEPNPIGGFTGKVIFRPRVNNRVVCYYFLSGSEGFVQNNLVVRDGPKPANFNPLEVTPISIRIATFTGGVPGPLKGISNAANAQNEAIDWNLIKGKKTDGSYLEYHFEDSGEIQQIFSRGNFLP